MLIAILIISIFTAITVIFVICSIRINVEIRYNREGVNDHFSVSLLILNGLIKYKYETPKSESRDKDWFFRKVKKKENDGSKKKEKLSYGYMLEKIKEGHNYINDNQVLLSRIFNYLRCKVKIKKLDLDVTIGTDNAHHTAILTGLCWTVIGIVTSFIHNNLNLLEKNINIKPDYMGKKLKVDFFCILNARIGHIIIVDLIYLKHIKPFQKMTGSVNMAHNQTNHIF